MRDQDNSSGGFVSPIEWMARNSIAANLFVHGDPGAKGSVPTI